MHRTLGELVCAAIGSTFPGDRIEQRHQVALPARAGQLELLRKLYPEANKGTVCFG